MLTAESNDPSGKGSVFPSYVTKSMRESGCSRRARSTMSALMSTPVTCSENFANTAVMRPVPHPKSKT